MLINTSIMAHSGADRCSTNQLKYIKKLFKAKKKTLKTTIIILILIIIITIIIIIITLTIYIAPRHSLSQRQRRFTYNSQLVTVRLKKQNCFKPCFKNVDK